VTERDAAAELARRRTEYETAGLDVEDVDPDPMGQWRRWFDEAVAAGCVEPNAFVLSTVGEDGSPQSRYLLARGADADGFTFHTNYDAPKSRQLAAEPRAAMLFTWLQLHRQLRVVGRAAQASREESDAYFATRPRGSQLGAWASPQSELIADRDELDRLVAEVAARFADADVPRPPNWGGWRLRPEVVELWQGRPSRLHDRVRYRRSPEHAGGWVIERLAP